MFRRGEWDRAAGGAVGSLALCAAVALGGIARASSVELPADVEESIRSSFVVKGMETRYLGAAVDLDGDGRDEILVHVVGPAACGTGGCPTLVFTARSGGYRLVSTISVSRPPIRVGARSSNGWRDLVVRIGGGGGRSGDVELHFDGVGYPDNPTVAGAGVEPARLEGARVAIDEFASFQDAKPFAATPVAAQPSFDCAKARSAAERAICSDSELAALDRELADAYSRAMAEWPDDERTRQRDTQRRWLVERDRCAGADQGISCMRDLYRRRLAVIRIQGGQLEAPTAVAYVCEGQEGTPFYAAFYGSTEPRSVVLTYGDRQEIAFATPSGSGARYANGVVDFWEHHGEARVSWSDEALTCTKR